jgi:hypothetical protein
MVQKGGRHLFYNALHHQKGGDHLFANPLK